MTKLQRTMGIIVSVIVALTLAVTVAFSIHFGAAQNNETFGQLVAVGMNVLDSSMKNDLEMLRTKADVMTADGRLGSTIRRGYVGTLQELYYAADLDDNVYCMYTDENGDILWKSANYNLAAYDVNAALKNDRVMAGYYTDANVPLSAVYIAPVKYRMGDEYITVGAMFLGCEISNDEEIQKVKESTGCDFVFFTISGGNATPAVSTITTDAELIMPQEAVETVCARDTCAMDVKIGSQTYMGLYEPIVDLNNRVVGSALSCMSSVAKDTAKQFMVSCMIIVAGLLIPLAFFLVMIMMRKIALDPLTEAGLLVQGMNNGDLSMPDIDAKLLPDNEVGEFAHRLEDTKHTLSAYVTDISRVLDAMAGGDFTGSASIEYLGDFAKIQESFERIRGRLSGIVHEIDRSSEDVYEGSEQMAAGSQLLADGTVTQAAAIEELSGKISSVLEKTRANADNAYRASELSNSMERSSLEQNEAMERLTEAMEEITTRSAEISNIIKAIDNIAFQTNILALNAAVEAARAGAAGKGFAVVADEVRNLAAKSADAAKETSQLITATAEAVNVGRELVEQTAGSMKEITRRAEETSRLVNAISAESANQARDIDRVTDALERISGVVSQNSATAEESAASCQQLASRSKTLKEQVKVLKA